MSAGFGVHVELAPWQLSTYSTKLTARFLVTSHSARGADQLGSCSRAAILWSSLTSGFGMQLDAEFASNRRG